MGETHLRTGGNFMTQINPPDDRPIINSDRENDDAPEILAVSSPASGKAVTRREFIRAGLVVSAATILAGTWTDLSHAQGSIGACTGDRCGADKSGACRSDTNRQQSPGRQKNNGMKGQTGGQKAPCMNDRCGVDASGSCRGDRCITDSTIGACTRDQCRSDTSGSCRGDGCFTDSTGSACSDRCVADASGNCRSDGCFTDNSGACRSDR